MVVAIGGETVFHGADSSDRYGVGCLVVGLGITTFGILSELLKIKYSRKTDAAFGGANEEWWMMKWDVQQGVSNVTAPDCCTLKLLYNED